jgi:hypothetical protein
MSDKHEEYAEQLRSVRPTGPAHQKLVLRPCFLVTSGNMSC